MLLLWQKPALVTAPSIGIRSEQDWPYGANVDLESRQMLFDWASYRGYRLSQRGYCLHWLRGKRPGAHNCLERYHWMDHVTCWTKDGKPAVLIAQPYGLTTLSIEELALLGQEFDVTVDGTGWYGCGTVMVEISPRPVKT